MNGFSVDSFYDGFITLFHLRLICLWSYLHILKRVGILNHNRDLQTAAIITALKSLRSSRCVFACVWPRLLTSSWLCWCQDTSIEWCFCRHTLCWNLQVKWLWCYWSEGSIFSFGVLTGNTMWLLHLTEGERVKKKKKKILPSLSASLHFFFFYFIFGMKRCVINPIKIPDLCDEGLIQQALESNWNWLYKDPFSWDATFKRHTLARWISTSESCWQVKWQHAELHENIPPPGGPQTVCCSHDLAYFSLWMDFWRDIYFSIYSAGRSVSPWSRAQIFSIYCHFLGV